MLSRLTRLLPILALLIIAAPLGGCANGKLFGVISIPTPGTPINNPVTPSRFSEVEAAYGIALAGANAYIRNYRTGHKCTVSRPESVSNPCSRRSVVLAMQSAIGKAKDARTRAADYINAHPTLDASALIDAYQQATDALQEINDNPALGGAS